MSPQEWDGHTHLPRAKERCPHCKGPLLIDIEPFEGTVYYCRKCQKNVKMLPIRFGAAKEPEPQ